MIEKALRYIEDLKEQAMEPKVLEIAGKVYFFFRRFRSSTLHRTGITTAPSIHIVPSS